ncbi:hypothetical protein V6N13_134218 [Hibiscus sabdariffa]|uniref:Uncharacterized protein n=1 Tax=Hibiscus sabdariffa TaxID=183260 RepID=A0ABR2R3C4_9ROSI
MLLSKKQPSGKCSGDVSVYVYDLPAEFNLASPFSFECLYQYVVNNQPLDNMELGSNPPVHREPPLSHVGSREGRSLLRPCVQQNHTIRHALAVRLGTKCMRESTKCENGNPKCYNPSEILKVMRESQFCLQAPGDSFTRRYPRSSFHGTRRILNMLGFCRRMPRSTSKATEERESKS